MKEAMSITDIDDKYLPTLTVTQGLFVHKVIENIKKGGTKTELELAKELGLKQPPKSPKLQQYIEAVLKKYTGDAKNIIRANVQKAATVLTNGLDSEVENIKMRAAENILDRVPETSKKSHTIQHKIDYAELLDKLATTKEDIFIEVS